MMNDSGNSGDLDKFEYRTLASENDFSQCVGLQKDIFRLSDTDVISPLFLKLFARQNPPVGIALGVFNDSKLVGFAIGFSTFERISIYILMIGVKEEYQDSPLGKNLLLKYREFSRKINQNVVYGIFDPLDARQARLYFSGLGFVGTDYDTEAANPDKTSANTRVPVDKLRTRWDIGMDKPDARIEVGPKIYTTNHFPDYPVVTPDHFSESPAVLVEIPENFIQLKYAGDEEIMKMRLNSRKIFVEYINNRKYCVTDCIAVEAGNTEKLFYLLEKR